MKDFLLILIAAIGVFTLFLALIYMIGFIRTKDKNAGYISIAMMVVAIISTFYLTFR